MNEEIMMRAQKAIASIKADLGVWMDETKSLRVKLDDAEMRAEVVRLRNRLRDTAQILIEETGASGPMDAEDAARKAIERMVNLRALADEKAAEAGLYARRMEQAQGRAIDALREKRAAEQRAEAAEAEVERLRAELAQVRAEGEATSRVAERPLGDHDARNVLWLSGRSLKQTNLTSPAALRACERFEATPRVEVAGSFPRNGPARIDALVALINECHEIHSEWHGRLISRAEAEAYVRGGAVGGAA